ncbi:type II secretion system F family protein [Streptomyces sp. SL13]|uniref:Type II secretion system F family protein n=1 Tax=Streptantibioticus silvisoli TaxID=2705255 RepID=A0AA90H8U5_9ACTN|nr:type II secretion system F family protein [Streptantibioticus silvisoli]MDI5974031.1 type II secretion system F family protein [Streptantibioticus silvisoli]
MSLTMFSGLMFGVVTAGGFWLIALGLLRPERTRREHAGPWRTLTARFGWRRLGAALLSGVLTGAVTGWPVGALLAAAAALCLPQVLSRDGGARVRTETLEATAVWAEMLRDTLSAAAGLEQAVLATASIAPPALRPYTMALAVRVEEGLPLAGSLRDFADEVADPVVDTVVAALVMASERQARRLADLLGSLASSTREQVAMRLRIDAGRARVVTSVRVVTATTLGMAVGLVLLNRPYLQPFSGLEGQSVLALVGGLFAGGFAWLNKVARFTEEPRILAPAPVTPSEPRQRHLRSKPVNA